MLPFDKRGGTGRSGLEPLLELRLLVILLLMLVLPLGCSSEPSAAQRPRIGFLLSSMEKERYHKDRAAFVKRVEELGGEVAFDSAGGDAAQQVKLGTDLLARKVDVLVVQPVDGEVGRALAQQAKALGVPVVAYDRLPAGAGFAWHVTHDSEAVGRSQVEYAARALRGKGQVAILQGPSENPVAQAITRGASEALKEHPGLEVVAVLPHADWTPALARDSLARLLEQHPGLGAVLANNSALARGAVELLRERDRAGQVYVAGADADLTNCQWVVQGLQGMDVLKPIQPLAQAAADVAMALARGETPGGGYRVDRGGPVPSLIIPVSPFDRSNLEQVVVVSGFHPREALFGREATARE